MLTTPAGRGFFSCHRAGQMFQCRSSENRQKVVMTNIWFNKSFSGIYNAIAAIRHDDVAERYRLLVSHTHADFAAFEVADEAFLEPKSLNEADYVSFCLEACQQRQVGLFVPGKQMAAIARARDRFADIGTRLLLAGDAQLLDTVEDKVALYRSLPAGTAPLPDYRVVRTLAEFDEAIAAMRDLHAKLCFKPVVSVYGLGFRIVAEDGGELQRLLGGETVKIGLEHARRLLGEQPEFRPVMVMEFLPGHERSVDCIGHHGELLRCVVRKKPLLGGGAQRLEENAEIVDIVRNITAACRLHGLYNIQLKDNAEGQPFLLEINPRMSGGLHYACLSGLNFPYWAIRLALGDATPADLPQPQLGLKVQQITHSIVVTHHSLHDQ